MKLNTLGLKMQMIVGKHWEKITPMLAGLQYASGDTMQHNKLTYVYNKVCL